jgi:hypothetical protein
MLALMSTEPRKSHALAWIVTTTLLLSVLYVLSIGPVHAYSWKAYRKRTISEETFKRTAYLYRPLVYVSDKSPHIKLTLKAYLRWWYDVTGANDAN